MSLFERPFWPACTKSRIRIKMNSKGHSLAAPDTALHGLLCAQNPDPMHTKSCRMPVLPRYITSDTHVDDRSDNAQQFLPRIRLFNHLFYPGNVSQDQIYRPSIHDKPSSAVHPWPPFPFTANQIIPACIVQRFAAQNMSIITPKSMLQLSPEYFCTGGKTFHD